MKKSDRKALVITFSVLPLIAISLLGVFSFGASLYVLVYEGIIKNDFKSDYYLTLPVFLLGIPIVCGLTVLAIVFWSKRIIEDGVYVFKDKKESDKPEIETNSQA